MGGDRHLKNYTAAHVLQDEEGAQLTNWNREKSICDAPIKNRPGLHSEVGDLSPPPRFTYGNSYRLTGSPRDNGEVGLDPFGMKSHRSDHNRYDLQSSAEAFISLPSLQCRPPVSAFWVAMTGAALHSFDALRGLKLALEYPCYTQSIHRTTTVFFSQRVPNGDL